MDVDGDGMDAYDELFTGDSDTNPDNIPSRSEVDEKVKLKGLGNDAVGKDANEEKIVCKFWTALDVSDNEKLEEYGNAIHQIFEKSGEHPLQAHFTCAL